MGRRSSESEARSGRQNISGDLRRDPGEAIIIRPKLITAVMQHGRQVNRIRRFQGFMVSTKTNQDGDKFTAYLVEPKEFEGAIIEGHIGKVKRSGKLTGQTELALEFDSITFKDGTTSEFRAQVERVYATEQVKTIDEEGTVQSGSTTKDTTIRSAGGGALGAIIGGIAGGGKGAAIGAILGAGVGAGSVYVQGNKDLIFDPGTEMQVRTFGPKK